MYLLKKNYKKNILRIMTGELWNTVAMGALKSNCRNRNARTDLNLREESIKSGCCLNVGSEEEERV